MAQPVQAAVVQSQSGQRLLSQASYASWAADFKATKDITKQAKYLQDLKDHVDARTGENLGEFFTEVVAGILLPRLKGEAVFVNNLEYKNRLTCLETLERTPRTEHSRPLLPDIFQTLIGLLERDTEELAVVALRILGELHRSTGFETEAPAFLDVIKRAHMRLPNTVAYIFSAKASAPQSGQGGQSGPSAVGGQPGQAGGDPNKKDGPAAANEPKTRSEHSLKLLTETHNSILLLFKNLPGHFNLTEWIQIMIGTLQLVPPENALASNRALYSDLILAQTKTFSLISTLLVMVLPRKDEQQTQAKLTEVANSLPYLKHLPVCIVQLLKNCPPEAISTRRDIIVALRQLVTAQSSYVSHQTSLQQQNGFSNPAITNPGWMELWTNFLEQLDEFLDEKVLVGTGRTAHETLRSSAWTVVAEYVNQSRNKLSLPQLTKLVGIYGKHAHDATLPATSVSFSLRLLSKLSEVVAMPDANEAASRAQLLTKILDIFVNKLSSMKKQLPSILLAVAQADHKANAAKQSNESSSSSSSESSSTSVADSNNQSSSSSVTSSKQSKEPVEKDDEEKVAEETAKWTIALEAAKDAALSKDESPTPLHQLIEMRSMVSTTINVLKTAVTQLQNHHMQHRTSKFAFVEETYILNRLVRNAMKCLSAYDQPKLADQSSSDGDSGSGSSSSSSSGSSSKSSGADKSSNAMMVDATSSGSSASSKSSFGKNPVFQPSLTCAPGVSEQFEKDCNILSGFFINLDTNTFEDLLTANLPYMYSCILEFPFLAVVLQSLMSANLPPTTSPARPYIKTMNDIILTFLITKIPTLANAEAVEAGILQRLFKAIFQTIGRQVDDPPMSPSWAPLLSGVVTQVLRLATETKDPLNLFALLKYLFRNIPKHDIWSKELAHSLPTIVDTINRIQENTSSQVLKDLLIELPLTLPLRVSAMLPCFRLFLKPLLAALEASESEGYVYQTKSVHALRFLEGYIGQFSAEFFEPLIAEHKPRLLRALWRHVRQPPATFTSQVMRILGKMGGRIRPYALPQLPITNDDASSLTLALSFDSIESQLREQSEKDEIKSDDASSGTSTAPASTNTTAPVVKTDPAVQREPRIIELPLLDSILSARRILFVVVPPSSVSAQLTARKLSAFNFLKGCLFALMRPYVDTSAPTKHIKSFTAEDLSALDPIDPSHPVRLVPQSQYPAFVKIKDHSAIGLDNKEGERVKTIHQLQSEQHSLKMILSSLITSASTDSLKSAATELLEQVCAHFALLFVSNASPNPSNLLELDPIVLVDAITDVLSSENRDHASAALSTIDLLLENCQKLDPEHVAPKEDRKSDKKSSSSSVDKKDKGEKEQELNEGPATSFLLGLPVLTQLVQRLCDVCFKREWYYKAGGCLGIRHLLKRMPTAWIRHQQLPLLQAILFVMKDYPLGATVSVTEDATQTFLKVLQACNSSGLQMVGEPIFDEALFFLASQLTSTNALVRKTVQASLDKLAEWSGSEVTELLEPHRQLIVSPILQHSLSRVGPKLQQAYLDAAAYCLSLRPPLMPDMQELKPFLAEALALAETEEAMRNVPLGSALVDALAAAVVGWKPFQSTENAELRTKTIVMFLKTLNAQNRPVVQCAKRGLEQVVAADLWSRKTLQDVVSPTLTSLSSGKLSEHMLEGLARFLGLFPKVFTPELGKMLLDQLTPYITYGDPSLSSSTGGSSSAMQGVSQSQPGTPGVDGAPSPMTSMTLPKLEPNESPLRVTAAVMEICHLLPQANKLLERVVDCTLKLEARSAAWGGVPGERRRVAPKELTSLFRAPLAKYLNRLPQEALTYFLSKLQDPEHTYLLVRCLKSEHSPALREELAKSATKLIDAAFTPQASANSAEEAFQMQYSGILITKTLLNFYPDWLSQNKDVLTKLHSLWNSSDRLERLKNEASLSLRHARETTYLIRCLLHYLRHNQHDTTLFLDLISALTLPYCTGMFELIEFYNKFVPDNYSLQAKRALLEAVLADFTPDSATTPQTSAAHRPPGFSFSHKQQILKSFVIRIFEVAVERNQQLLTEELIGLFLNNFFTLERDSGGLRHQLAYELLSILGLMLKNAPTELEEHLKDLIRFGWAFQRNEDPYTKQNANSLFSAIIKDRTAIAPPRIRIMVYAALMRSYQSEVRSSVREALDLLVPVLLAPSATPDQQYIKWTRKVLYEESQVPQQLFHILYVLSKYEACFRPWRSMFYTSLATSFPKLSPHNLNTPIEQRRLAIAVIDLLLTWERMRIKNSESPKVEEAADGSSNAMNTTPSEVSGSSSSSSSSSSTATENAATSNPNTMAVTPATPASETSASASSSSLTNSDGKVTPGASDASGNVSVMDFGDGKLPTSQIEHILSTLMTASLMTEPQNRAGVPPSSSSSSGASNPSSNDLSFVFMKLVREALAVWPSANMKLNFIFSRVLDKPDSPGAPHARALILLDTIFRAQPATILNYAQELARCLPPLISLETPDTNRALCQLLSLLLTKYPIRVPGGPLDQLYASLKTELEKVMQVEKPLVDNILSVLKVLLKKPVIPSPAESDVKKDDSASNAASTTASAEAESSTTTVVKSENSMDVDSSSSAQPPASETATAAPASSNAMDVDGSQPQATQTAAAAVTAPAAPPAEPAKPEPDILGSLLMPMIKMCIRLKDLVLAKQEIDPATQQPVKKPDSTPLLVVFRLLAPRLSTMAAELRRHFVTLIYILFDKSNDEQFLLSLLALAENLQLDYREANALLQRLRRFDRNRTGPIGEAYFNLIFTFYNRYQSSEVSTLEPAFLSVLTSRDSATRAKFTAKFQSRLPHGFAPRFEALHRPQTWEAIPHLYWIQPSVDILLAQADTSLPATLGVTAARLPQPSYAASKGASSSSARGTGQSQAIQSILEAEKSFVDTLTDTTIGDLMRPLSDLLYHDPELAGSVWSSLFQNVMKTDSTGILKRKCWQHMQSMLSQDSGGRGQRLAVPVAQFLLRAAHKANLHMPPALVKYVGHTYHAWHLAIHMLEERITAGFAGLSPDAPKGVVVSFPNHPPALYQALGDLYSRLYEEDFATALTLNQSVMDDTRAGLILVQQGAFSRAQEVFYQALHDSSKGMIENVPEQEQSLWETQWIECAKRLNQWDVVASYAKSVGSIELAADAAWKLGDWESLKDLLGKFPSTDSPKSAALQAYSMLAEKNSDVDSSHAMNLVLTQWVNLPRIPCAAYTPLLVTLQRFIDIHDSVKIVKDMKAADFLSKIQDIKTYQLRMWRERLPHECDDMTLWHDVLQWRQHMFSMLTHTLTMIPGAQAASQSPAPPVLGIGHHEAAWAINKMAHVARKQGLVDICFTSLPKIYELPNIEVQDAFTKVCEHIKCYFRLPLPFTRGILDIINTTNLNYFSAIQKAEFFHLKAEFYARTGAYEEAAKAYSTAVLLYPSLPKVWSGWGKFYDNRFEALLGTSALLTANGIEPMPSASPNATASATQSSSGSGMDVDPNPSVSNPSAPGTTTPAPPKSRLTAAHYALSCYMLALKANPQISSRKMLARVLWLLEYDDELSEDEVSFHQASVAGSVLGSSAIVPTTPATPSMAGAATSLGVPGDVSSDATDGRTDSSKKRDATSPVAEDDRNLKKRKLTESASGEGETHQLDESAPTAATKMEVDAVATPSDKPSAGAPLSFSSMMVPPTPNTPATPSAYMIAATPMTPSTSLTNPNQPSSSSASAPAPPDPVITEIQRVRKMRLLCSTFMEHAESLPSWLWLIWIPQLLTGLDRPEALAMQAVLKKVAGHYPHAIFFPLRTWILERKKLLGQGSEAGLPLSTERMALRLAEDVMQVMKDKQPAVISDMERMTSELEQLATLTLPEMLLDSLSTVVNTSYDSITPDGVCLSAEDRRTRLATQLQLIHQHIFLQSEVSSTPVSSNTMDTDTSASPPTTAAPTPVTRSKGRGRKATDAAAAAAAAAEATPTPTPPPTTTATSSSSIGNNISASAASAATSLSSAEDLSRFHSHSTEVIRAQLLPKFEEDFAPWLAPHFTLPSSSQQSSQHQTAQNNFRRPSVRLTVEKLRHWVADMRDMISSLPTWAELRKATWLAQFQNENTLEVPGIYLEDKEMSPETVVYIDKFESPIKISKSNGLPRRIINIRGSNGQFYHWFVQSSSALPVSLAHILPIVPASSSSSSSTIIDGSGVGSSSASVSPPHGANHVGEGTTPAGRKSSTSGSPISASGDHYTAEIKLEDAGENGASELAAGLERRGVRAEGKSLRFSGVTFPVLWAREARFTQLMRLFSRMVQKEVHVRKRAAPLNVPQVVQLSPSLRIVSVDKHFITLDDAVEEWHKKQGTSPLDVLAKFDGLLGGLKQVRDSAIRVQSGDSSFALASRERLSMYESARHATSDEALLDLVYAHLGDHFEGVWHMRKQFVGSLAQQLLLEYLFSTVLSSNHHSLSISPATGQLQRFDMSPAMNLNGEIMPTPAQPFRLSPNVVRFIGPTIKGSLLDATLTACTIVLSKKNPLALLTHHMHLYFRDDLLQLHRQNLISQASAEHSDSPAELNLLNPTNIVLPTIKKNIALVVSRLNKIAPPSLASYRPNSTVAINSELDKLLDASVDPLLASKMPISWASWM